MNVTKKGFHIIVWNNTFKFRDPTPAGFIPFDDTPFKNQL